MYNWMRVDRRLERSNKCIKLAMLLEEEVGHTEDSVPILLANIEQAITLLEEKQEQLEGDK